MSVMTPTDQATAVARLVSALPPGSFLSDPESLACYAEDIFYEAARPMGLFRPSAIEEVAPALAKMAAMNIAVAPRGGGMSYTKGYLPDGPFVAIDMQALDAVERIDRDNMTVLVQAGCTWRKLHEALEAHGLRVPSWGPLSGIRATVGGTASQNAVFWGGGTNGSVADSIMGVEAALTSGETIRTGALAHGHARPFFRAYGPDLTGVLIGDCGAFGVKTRLLLRLVRTPAVSLPASFTFETRTELLDCMAGIAQEGLAAQQFGFDRNLIAIRTRPQGLSQDLQNLASLVRSASSLGKGVRDVVSVARAGRDFLKDVHHTLHLMTEGENETVARARMAQVEAVVARHHGRQIESTVPKLMQARPFGSLSGILGPNGERWVPLHVLVPLSDANSAMEEIENILNQHLEKMNRSGVQAGILFSAIAGGTALIEVMFFWPDAIGPLHADAVGPKLLDRVQSFPQNAEARALVDILRQALLDCFAERDSAHLQIGRTYSWAQTANKPGLRLIRELLNSADPKGLMNPGVLNLDRRTP